MIFSSVLNSLASFCKLLDQIVWFDLYAFLPTNGWEFRLNCKGLLGRSRSRNLQTRRV